MKNSEMGAGLPNEGPEQRSEIFKSRTIHDAELLKTGAEYVFDEGKDKPRLELTAAQVGRAKNEMDSFFERQEFEKLLDRAKLDSEAMKDDSVLGYIFKGMSLLSHDTTYWFSNRNNPPFWGEEGRRLDLSDLEFIKENWDKLPESLKTDYLIYPPEDKNEDWPYGPPKGRRGTPAKLVGDKNGVKEIIENFNNAWGI